MPSEYRINVTVDPTRAEAGVRRVHSALDRTANRAERLRGLLTRAFAVLGGAAIGTGAVRTIAQFEQAMSSVRAVTQATEDQFQSLSNEARRLGSTTRFTATQAGEGMLFLARAGFDTQEVLESVEGTLQLAQAGALDLGRAADIASNILTGFRLGVSETGRVVDVLALASNSANTSVEQMGDAMKFVAPVAAGLGVGIEEAAAAVGALSDAGLQGSLAGTGLRRVLAELESPATKTRDILESLGLTAQDVRVSQVGLTQALIALRDAGVDTGQALEIFGDRGGPAFEVLASSIPRVRELTGSLQNAGGTAAEMARIMDENLNGALLRVRSAFEAVVLAVGNLGASDFLTQTFDALAVSLRFVAENIDLVVRGALLLVGAFALPRIAAVVAAFGRLSGAAFAVFRSFGPQVISGIGAAFLALTRGVQGATGAVGALTAAVRLLLRAALIGFLIEAVFLLADAIGAARRNFESLGDFADVVAISYLQTFTDITNYALDTADRIVDAFADLGSRIGSVLQNLVRSIREIFGGVEEGVTRGGGAVVVDIIDEATGLPLSVLQRQRLQAEAEAEIRRERAARRVDFVTAVYSPEQQARLRTAGQGAADDFVSAFEARYRVRTAGDNFVNIIRSGLEGGPVDAPGRVLEEGGQSFGGFFELGRVRLLEDQRQAFDNLRNTLDPLASTAREYRDAQQLINLALSAGNVTFEEADRLHASLAERYRDQLDPLGVLNRELNENSRLLTFNVAEREVEEALTRRINELKLDGVILSERERATLRADIEFSREKGRQLQLEQQAYNDLRDPEEDYIDRQLAIIDVVRQQPALQDRAREALDRARITLLQTRTDLASGFERGLLMLSQEFSDFASLAEEATTGWVRGFEDALVQGVATGRFEFGSLVDAIIADLARISIRQLITEPLVSGLREIFSGGGAGGGAGGFVGGIRDLVGGLRDVLSGSGESSGCGVLDFFTGTIGRIKDLFGSLTDGGLFGRLGDLFSGIRNALSGEGCGVLDFFGGIINGVKDLFGGADSVLGNIGGAISSVVSGITSGITSAVGSIGSAVGSIAGAVSSGLGNVASVISAAVRGIQSIGNIFSGGGGGLEALLGGAGGFLQNLIPGIGFLAGILSLSQQRPDRPISDYYDGLGEEVFTALPDQLSGVAAAMAEVAAQVEDPTLSQALRDFAGAFQTFADAGLGPETGLNNAFQALDGIKNLVAGAESLIVNLETAGIDTEPFAPIIAALREGQEAMYEAAQEAALAIQQGFEQSGETAETAAEGFSGTFEGDFSEMVGMIGSTIMDGLGKMARDFMAFIGSIPESVAAIGNATATASEQIGAAHGSYAEAFAAGAAEIGDTLAGVQAGVEQSLESLGGSTKSAGETTATSVNAANENMAAAFGAMEGSVSESSTSVAGTVGAASGTMSAAFGAMEGSISRAGASVANAASSASSRISRASESVSQAAASFSANVPSGFEGGPADAPGSFGGGPGPADATQPFQMGGLVVGPGTGTSDSIIARLSNGEYVVNAASTQRYLPLLEAINDNPTPRFQNGGPVTGGGSPGVVVEINDFRGSEAPPVEVRQTRDPNGRQRIKVEVRDAVLELFEEGELDSAVDNRFGVRPAVA